MRAMLFGITVRKSDNIDRKRKYRPQYRPRNNLPFCGSFILHTSVAGDAVDVLRTFLSA